jgi:hypothetical protein
MAEGDNKTRAVNYGDERFKYIGFEVFPGKAGDIFKSDEERKSLVAKVMAKFGHSESEVRDRCTLMETRVTKTERGILTLAAVLMMVALLIPCFSGYFEIVNVKQVPAEAPPAAPGAEAAVPGAPVEMTTITTVSHDNRSLTGIGAFIGIGTYGGMVFSGGFALMLTGLLLLLYLLSCLGLGLFNLHILYRVKIPDPDAYVLYLKKMLRYNWIPVLIWLAMLLLSIVGASYGFNPKGMLKQVGDSYGMGAFIGLSSFGIYMSLGGFLIASLKGKEI